MATGPGTRDVVLTRVFDAPIEKVWNAWGDPEQVKRWWGPMGFTCPVAEMDFREGGTSLVCMRAPVEYGGMEIYTTWTYTKIEPHARFEYVLRFSNERREPLDPAALGIPAGVPREVHNVNVFKDLGDGRTELTIAESSYTTEEAHDTSKAGLEQVLDKMAAILK
jgi:uncharacterized protein YndB with AHSA1/START domain